MKKTIVRTISLIMALALALGTFTSGQAESNQSVAALTFVAEADSRVPEAKPDLNFGNDTVLYVDGGTTDPDIESYIRFTVTGISGAVSGAQLRLYVTDATRNGPALYTTSNTWTEAGITWNTRPARTSSAIEDKGALAVSSWVEYNVTNVITGNGTYSFVLATDAVDLLGLSAREGSTAPQLVVTLGDTPLPPSTATPTATTIQPTFTVVAPTLTPTTVLPSPTAILPTATPITILPTATAIQLTPTSTTVSVQPTPTTPSQDTSSVGTSTNGGMWISSAEIMSLPTSGTAWDKMRTAAYGSWGIADLQNQENKHAIYTLAGALTYARTGDASLRSKVRDAILAAKRSLDETSEWQSTNGVLATGRQLGTYVISADLIDLKNYDSATDQEFRSWLTAIRTTNIGTHGRWKAITYTCENAAGNWNTFACASRIAASIYLGDTADVDRAANILRAFFGERAYYPANAPGSNGYFEHTAGYQASWSCVGFPWTGVNSVCTSSGINIDGVLVEDASRGGGCCVLQGDGISYSWEALQGLFFSTELLYRTGRYGNPYDWSNQALKRSLDFMQRSGWGISNVAKYVPWIANARYGTSYPTAPSFTGRIMSWGDWLYKTLPISGNAAVPGVALSYIDGIPKAVYADANGNYSLPVTPGWSGTVTPSLPGVTFSPTHISYNNVTSNYTAQDYTASVILSGNTRVGGTTLNYTGGATVANGNGNYSITVPYGWSGTVAPLLGGDAFCPGRKTYAHVTANQTSQNYAHTTCPQFDPMTQWTTNYSYNAQQWRVEYHPRLLGDVDGDGDDDIVGFGYDRVLVALSNGANGFAPMTQWTTNFSYNAQQWQTEYHPRLLGDVNGDGKADIVGFGYDRVLVALSTGTSFAPMRQWTTDYSYNAQGWKVQHHPRVLGDVDGDGDDDIIGFGYDRVLVALSNGSNSFAPMRQWTTDYSYNAQGWRVQFHPRLVGDVNGDGRADIVGFGYDRVLVALSTGTSFAPMTQWTTDYSYNAQGWRVEYHPRLLGDVNGDGKDDIIGFGYDRVLVALSNGSGFASMVQVSIDYSYNAQGWRVEYHPRLTGDFNGDGLDDLIGFGYDRVLVALSK